MKKIVRLTESKLVELIRGIVSEQQVMSPTLKAAKASKAFNWDLYWKKRDAFLTANSDLASGRYQSNPKAQAAMVAKVKALEADYEKMSALLPPIPKVTTTKFMPPEIKHDEEVTKPEPAEEPEVTPTYTPEPEPEIEPVPAPLQESIKRTLRMFNTIK